MATLGERLEDGLGRLEDFLLRASPYIAWAAILAMVLVVAALLLVTVVRFGL